jgi:hypothetical protein
MATSSKKVKVNLYLDANDWKALKKISQKTMIPTSALVRKAIKAVVAEHK